MVNYAYAFSQSELGKYFEWIMTDVIMHSTHYLFSDLPKAYSEFLKSAPGASSSCSLYNNHVKMMSCKTAVHDFLGESSQVRALCVACRQTEQDIEKIVEDKDSQNTKSRQRWQRSCLQITWKRKNWQNLRKRKSWHKLWKQFIWKRERKKVRLTPWGIWKPFDLAWTYILNKQEGLTV